MLNLNQVAEQALYHFGERSQISKSIEELAELTSALARMQNNREMLLNVIEEIADCFIVLEEMKILFGTEIVDNKIQQKLRRLVLLMDQASPDTNKNRAPLKEKCQNDLG